MMFAWANICGMNHHAAKIIDAIGGTADAARFFEVRMPSVSDWRRHGIPRARMMYVKAARPEALDGVDVDAATALHRAPMPEPAEPKAEQGA